MRIVLFAKLFALFTVVAMIGVFVAPYLLAEYQTTEILFRFLQFEALALALSIIVAFILPQVIGVAKGETVLIITNDPVANRTVFKMAKALESAKVSKEIKIQTNGVEQIGVVESYSGLITPARVSIKLESNIKVI